jgi:hypothetical protein
MNTVNEIDKYIHSLTFYLADSVENHTHHISLKSKEETAWFEKLKELGQEERNPGFRRNHLLLEENQRRGGLISLKESTRDHKTTK